MTHENKDVKIRFRLTPSDAARCRQAAEKLGITEMSIFYRWALENSATQVLGGAQQQPQQPQQPQRKPRTPKVVQPKTNATFDLAPQPVAPEAPPPEVAALFGIPLYSAPSDGPNISVAPMPDFGDDDDL